METISDSIDVKNTDIFGQLGLDVLGEIFSFVDAVSLNNLLSLSANLWRLRTDPKLQIRINPYKQHYKRRNWNGGLCASVENNNLVQALFFIKKGAWKFDLALKHAAKAGHKDMIHFLISKGANSWRWGMLSSAFSGNLELVDFFHHQSTTGWTRAQKRMPSYQELDRYSFGMREAALGGHKEIVEYFVQKGADRWNMGLRAAAMGGHTDLIDYFINKGASDWAGAMYYAIKGGHRNLFEFFKEKSQRLLYAGTSPFLKHMVKAAVYGGHRDILIWMMDHDYGDWKLAFHWAITKGMLDIVTLCLEKENSLDVKAALEISVQTGRRELIELLIQHGADVNDGLVFACQHNSTFIPLFSRHGANDWNRALVTLCPNRTSHCVQATRMVLQKGPTNLNEALLQTLRDWDSINMMKTVQLLVDYGANDWNRALAVVVSRRKIIACLQLVKYFLDKGADNLDQVMPQPTNDLADIEIINILQARKKMLADASPNNLKNH